MFTPLVKSGLKTRTKTCCWTKDSQLLRREQDGGRKGQEVSSWGLVWLWFTSEFWLCTRVQSAIIHHALHLSALFFFYLLLQWKVMRIKSKFLLCLLTRFILLTILFALDTLECNSAFELQIALTVLRPLFLDLLLLFHTFLCTDWLFLFSSLVLLGKLVTVLYYIIL